MHNFYCFVNYFTFNVFFKQTPTQVVSIDRKC